MDDADREDDVLSGGASARFAWTIVAVLAGAFVAFAYAVGGSGSPESREPTRPSLADPTTITTGPKLADPQTTGPPGKPASTVIVRPATASLVHTLVSAWRDEAKTFCASPSTTPRQGLAKYATAEDYIRKAIEDAKSSKQKADEDAYTAIYEDLLQDSDAYTKRVITPEFIESIPWKDLLADGSKWSTSTDDPEFSCRVLNGKLTTSAPDADPRLQSVIGVLDQPGNNLRHFVLDMDFAISGGAMMYFHVSPRPGLPNERLSPTYFLVSGENRLRPGATYKLVATYVGSDLAIKVTGNGDEFPQYSPTLSSATRRSGGIAFEIPQRVHLTITRMRIKELR